MGPGQPQKPNPPLRLASPLAGMTTTQTCSGLMMRQRSGRLPTTDSLAETLSTTDTALCFVPGQTASRRVDFRPPHDDFSPSSVFANAAFPRFFVCGLREELWQSSPELDAHPPMSCWRMPGDHTAGAKRRAIKTNQDLLPETPWTNVFYDDFWGTLLTHSGSHKSYRPLCTLSFRLNHAVGGLEPWGYHLVNVALHGAVTGLFTSLARLLLGGGPWSLLAGLLFASHPVHTEAVAGVVGRADEGAALFFLLSLLCYVRHCELRGHAGRRRLAAWFLGSLACAACSMLWKELGVTVLAVSALYDVCVFHKLKMRQVVSLLYKHIVNLSSEAPRGRLGVI
ncbi:Transmembrane and TPR repeat-containing protein 2 [Liparis tanakae]|uniref:Transmembrane and TPR repeat-containing protein 2 n=1 Tax=Liparis tanakae TaxID=230148 RepID=A0A4Z2FNH3_9TELE|nr:Transmembrane and TPR repeat-containing protein 2 [Liparis tanakae]